MLSVPSACTLDAGVPILLLWGGRMSEVEA